MMYLSYSLSLGFLVLHVQIPLTNQPTVSPWVVLFKDTPGSNLLGQPLPK